MQKREVPFSILINLLKERKPFSTLGILFPLSTIFFTIFIFLFFNLNQKPYEKYDSEKIQKTGIEKNAVVSDIEMTNINFNGDEVKIISYEYDHEGKKISDQFKTSESGKIPDLKVGEKIRIKSLDNQSVIKDLEPFTLWNSSFFIVPVFFILLGIPFLLVALIPSLKNYNLYKTGIIKEAEIASMEVSTNVVSNRGLTTYRTGAQKIMIHYFFTGKNGEKIFGKSSTTDYSILNEKKPGDKIKIFVSEDDEHKSCIVPKLEAMKYNWNI
jgi:hypothetical protein